MIMQKYHTTISITTIMKSMTRKKPVSSIKICRHFIATLALPTILLFLTLVAAAPTGLVHATANGTNVTTTADMQFACISQNSTTTTTTPAVDASATTTTNTTEVTVAPGGAGIGPIDNNTAVDSAGSANMLSIKQTASQARTQIEEACTAIQNNDTQGAIMDLNIALKSIDNIVGNLTSTTTAGR